MRVPHAAMLLLLGVLTVILLMLLYSLVGPTRVLMSIAGTDDATASLLGSLLRVGTVFARSDP